MKNSHFRTPRTRDEAEWQPWGAAIEKQYTPSHSFGLWDVVLITLSVAILAAAVAIFFALVGLA